MTDQPIEADFIIDLPDGETVALRYLSLCDTSTGLRPEARKAAAGRALLDAADEVRAALDRLVNADWRGRSAGLTPDEVSALLPPAYAEVLRRARRAANDERRALWG